MITEKQVQVIRLCHHEFAGLTTKEAAKKMNCSIQTINRLLRGAKKEVPAIFPILTKWQWRVLKCLKEGYNRQLIAERFSIDLKFIDNTIQQLRKKGCHLTVPHKPTHYEPWMDAKVKEKF